MHFYAFAIVNIDESMRKRIPEIMEERDRETKRMDNEFKKMTFDEILDSHEKRKPNRYEKLLYALKQKVKKPLDKYCAYGNTEDENRKFDSWVLMDVFTPSRLMNDTEMLNDLFPQAIMNSDCSWIESEWSENDEENERLTLKWDKFVKKTLEENREKSVVLLIHCDS